MAKKSKRTGPPPVALNRRARYDYYIEETLEAGMVLMGSEVKSLRKGRASIGESYAAAESGGFFLINAYIPDYLPARHFGHAPRRPRKLLLHRKELQRLNGLTTREGMTVIPLSIYFSDRGFAKVELGLAKGKKKVDKRETEKKRDWQRDKARLMRDRG